LRPRYDVLVIGAGPAGASAAIEAARQGCSVLIVDKQRFPREKACGDTLFPDAVSALRKLDVFDRLSQALSPIDGLRVFAPNGSAIGLSWTVYTCKRSTLDQLLLDCAIDAGARFRQETRLVDFQEIDSGVRVKLRDGGAKGGDRSLQAKYLVLATGANRVSLANADADFAQSAFALRGYFKTSGRACVDDRTIQIGYHGSICPGYGWVVPVSDDEVNIGVGYCVDSRARLPTTNLRQLFDLFVEDFPSARAVIAGGEPRDGLKGAPLRTSLRGRLHYGARVFVVGEAAGTTYAWTGDGIGKAIQTGAKVGALLGLEQSGRATSPVEAYVDYVSEELRPLYRGYDQAQKWLTHPRVCNFIAKRARRNKNLTSMLEGMLSEEIHPETLFSPAGMFRALF
jgi:geranylgeranyl reductase family protein